MENAGVGKRTFYTELAYVFGLVFVAFGVAFMEKSDFGVSMVVAPAYLLHLKISQTYSFFTFGTAEYTLQAVLLIVMMLILRKFSLSYLFSFVTAFIYGMILDLCMMVIADIPTDSMVMRLVLYVVGMWLCAIGISLFFHTYIAPEVYELFVKELSAKFHVEIHRFKTCYDICSCLIGVILSFCFFGLWVFVGVKWGTIFCALINGSMIALCSKFFDKFFEFKDGLKLRKYFS